MTAGADEGEDEAVHRHDTIVCCCGCGGRHCCCVCPDDCQGDDPGRVTNEEESDG